MPNYQNGKIYMIWCEDDKYYGSTTVSLSRRMTGHRSKYNKCSSFIIFEKYGIEKCKIELVELFPCNSLEELRAREGYYIRNNNCVNKNIPDRNSSERYDDNKEQILERNKQYREDNKEQILERNKQYNEENKEYILERQRKYNKENKKQISEKRKERYQAKQLRCKILENNLITELDGEATSS